MLHMHAAIPAVIKQDPPQEVLLLKSTDTKRSQTYEGHDFLQRTG